MQKYLPILAGLGLLFFLLGCSGSKVRVLEEQVTQLNTQNDSLQTELQSARTNLAQAENSIQTLQETLNAKDETIAQQEEALSDLRFQNLELKANLEGTTQKLGSKEITLSGDFQADYNRAQEFFKKRWYLQAASLFKKLADSDRSHALADNCQYWLGECYFAQKQYENAQAEFEKVFTFPQSNKSDAAQLKIALCLLQMNQYPEAKEQLVHLLSTYPSSEYVPRARSLLEQIP